MVTIIKKLTGGAYPFYEYACLSTDIKPVSLVPENSICHEIDTGKHFYFGNGEWKELPPKGGGSGECGGNAPLIVTMTSGTGDKTYGEIHNAFYGGIPVIIKGSFSGSEFAFTVTSTSKFEEGGSTVYQVYFLSDGDTVQAEGSENSYFAYGG